MSTENNDSNAKVADVSQDASQGGEKQVQQSVADDPQTDKIDTKEILAQLEKLKKENDTVKGENFKYREKAREAQEADAIKKGEFKELFEKQKADNETLQARVKSYEDSNSALVEMELKSFSHEQKSEFDSMFDGIELTPHQKLNKLMLFKQKLPKNNTASALPASQGGKNPEVEKLQKLIMSGNSPQIRLEAKQKLAAMRT